MPMSEKTEKRYTKKQKRMRRLWLGIRPTVVMLVSLVIVFLLAQTTVNYVLAKYIEPVDRSHDPRFLVCQQHRADSLRRLWL